MGVIRFHIWMHYMYAIVPSRIQVSGVFTLERTLETAVWHYSVTNFITGLSAIDLSRTTPLQQVLLYIQMFLGSQIVVSWIVVLVRK
jgi:hypothetical protein